MTSRHLVVHGRVQGVFYRDWTVRTARSLGVSGWVRNLPDGTVEALVEGELLSVEQMIEAMRGGPPRASVSSIDVTEREPEGLDGFSRR